MKERKRKLRQVKKKKEIIEKPKINLDFIKVYEGKIDNKYEYYLKLESNNGSLTGNYFYKKKCENILVKGNLDSNGKITFSEYAYGIENDATGVFKGSIVNEKKVKGKWSDNNSKKYAFYFIETNENYDTALNNCKGKALKTLVIDEITLLEFPSTKENGKSWDGSFEGYKPDLDIRITDFNNVLLYNKAIDFNTVEYENKTNKDLPLKFILSNGVKIKESVYKNGIIIKLIDFDMNEDDIIGGVSIKKFKTHYDNTKTIQTFNGNGLKMKIMFHYE